MPLILIDIAMVMLLIGGLYLALMLIKDLFDESVIKWRYRKEREEEKARDRDRVEKLVSSGSVYKEK